MFNIKSINRIQIPLLLGVLLFMIIASAGCKSRKKGQKTDATNQVTGNIILSKMEVFNNLTKDWKYYSAKSKVAVEGKGIDKTVDVTLKMKKDEIIWASVGMFGFEGARIFMEPDSITIINKLDKTFSRLGWKQIETYTGTALTLKDVQAILISNPVFTDYKDYKNDTSNATFFVRKSDSAAYELTSNNVFTEIVKTFLVGQKSGKHLTINYSDYKNIEQRNIPSKISMIAKDGMDIFNIDMQINDINFGSFEALPTQVPSTFIRN